MVGRVDVARLAGVSPAVVSYVLNDSHPVAPATRERVEAAIEELGYRPNALARGLATARTDTLGLIMPELSNPYFSDLSVAIEDAAFAAGFSVLFGNSAQRSERERAYVQAFVDRKVDGVIAVTIADFSCGWEEVIAARVPIVSVDRLSADFKVPSISVDSVDGAIVATEHIIGHGCRRVACVTGDREMTYAFDRGEGWRIAVEAAGLESRAEDISYVDFTAEAGYAATLAHLERDPEIDGLFVSSDMQAVGALRALADAGRRAGEDVSLVSFDGTTLSEFTTPRLTAVTQPFARIGEAIVQLLVASIKDPDSVTPDMHQVLRGELVIRDSCGCHLQADGATADPARTIRGRRDPARAASTG